MTNKVVLITGASRGIGLKIANTLASNGYTVIGTSRSGAGQSDKITMVKMDVTDSDSVQQAVQQVVKEYGKIDVLINNAGVLGVAGAAEEVSMEQAQWIMNTNLWGVVRVTNAVLPHMRKVHNGKILNVSSLGGILSMPPFFAFYMASKHALEGYTASLRMEVKPFGISVSLLEPGLFKSTIEDTISLPEFPIKVYENMRNRVTVLDRMSLRYGADAQIVADAVVAILKSRKMRLRYPVGSQAKMISVLLRWLPYRLVERLFQWIYTDPNWQPDLGAIENGDIDKLGIRRNLLLNPNAVKNSQDNR